MFTDPRMFQNPQTAAMPQRSNFDPRMLQSLFTSMAGRGLFGGFPGNAPAAYRPLPRPQISQMPARARLNVLPPSMPTPYNPPQGALPPQQRVLSPTLNTQTGGYTTERIAQAIREGMSATPGATLEQTVRKGMQVYGISPEQALAAARMAASGGQGGPLDIGTTPIVNPSYDPAPRYVPPAAAATAAPTQPAGPPQPGTPEYYQWLISQGQSYNPEQT